MTLLEVMISLAIFSVFIVSYMASQGYSIQDSANLKEDIKLRELCLQVIDKITVDPPVFRESLTLTPETKRFEDDENYNYTTLWKRLIIPDLNKIKGTDPLEQEGKQNQQETVQKRIFDNVKKNLEKIIWQVEVTVESEITKNRFVLSTWLYDSKGKIQFDGL